MTSKITWQEILLEDKYTLEGNGEVLDSNDAERAALLAYSAGIEYGIELIVKHITAEMANETSTLLPLDLPQRIAEHLESIRVQVQGK